MKNFKTFIKKKLIIDELIHFRMNSSTKLNEDTKNDHISHELHKTTAAHITDKNEKEHILTYSGSSFHLNRKLIQNKELHDDEKEIHKTILKHAKPSGHSIELHSGISPSLGNKLGNLNAKVGDKLHSPAHISATHSEYISKRFALMNSDHRDRHFLHVSIKPHHKILHISRISDVPHEHETIIPAGSNLVKHKPTEVSEVGSAREHHHYYELHQD